jgi:uncharacterized membrane protein (UPF0127 family)
MVQPASPEPPRHAAPPAQRRGRWFVALFVLVLLGVSGTALWTNLARVQSKDAATQALLEPLTLVTASGRHAFQVEVMRTDEQRGRGLMFRQSLPDNRGMLFDFKVDGPVSMWMRNTYIPLDMVFIFADGRVHRVEANTEPLSERTIPAGANVRAVLELNAGTAARLGLRPGDRVEHGMFGG